MKQRWLILAWLLPLILAAAPEAKKRTPTGLKILSAATLEAPTALNPKGRPVALTVQNITDKTIVAVAGVFEEFRADGTHTYSEDNAAHGVAMDFDGPRPADPTHSNWIRPGQVTQLRLFAVGNPETASVKATITGLIYEDRTSEGMADMIFQQRREQGQKAREAASRETSPRKKAELEEVAKWFETHDRVEAQK